MALATKAAGGGRRRVGRREMRRIEDATRRQVTFSKRRRGLLKKASELSVLCEAEVALLVFSTRGRFFHFASAPSLEETINRYISHSKEAPANKKRGELTVQKMKYESLAREIDTAEAYTRKMHGDDLESCSLQELYDLQMQLEKSLSSIRLHKQKKLMDKVSQLKQQEKILYEENALLCNQCNVQPARHPNVAAAPDQLELDYQHVRELDDVDTELVIGRG